MYVAERLNGDDDDGRTATTTTTTMSLKRIYTHTESEGHEAYVIYNQIHNREIGQETNGAKSG